MNLEKNIVLIGLGLVLFSFSFSYAESTESCSSSSSSSQRSTVDVYSIAFVGLFSALVFALIGILPSLFIRTDADEARFVNSVIFKCLLAFAAGSLLAEVFLHLLPESIESAKSNQQQILRNGLNSIGSFFVFLTIEKFTELVPNAHALGVLNLIANFVDNSAHGTTVVGAFEASVKFGLVALLATIIHEIPHEFSDFALLLRDGYSRRTAIIAQLITSLAGTIGATIAYAMTAMEDSYALKDTAAAASSLSHHPPNHRYGSMIIPFTIGGFLYIALVGIIPDIIDEKNGRVSALQIVSFLVGVVFIYSLLQIEALLPLLFS